MSTEGRKLEKGIKKKTRKKHYYIDTLRNKQKTREDLEMTKKIKPHGRN